MHFVYFIEPYSSDYIIFGRSTTKAFYHRLGSYKGSHPKIEVIGIHPVENSKQAISIELELVKQFQVTNPERSKCEMLWNTSELREYILKNTIEIEPILIECENYRKQNQKAKDDRHKEKCKNDPEYNEHYNSLERNRYHEKYNTDPEFRENKLRRNRNRYWNNPEFRERERANARKRKRERSEAFKKEQSKNQLTFFD